MLTLQLELDILHENIFFSRSKMNVYSRLTLSAENDMVRDKVLDDFKRI